MQSTLKSVHVKELNCFLYQPVHFPSFPIFIFCFFLFVTVVPSSSFFFNVVPSSAYFHVAGPDKWIRGPWQVVIIIFFFPDWKPINIQIRLAMVQAVRRTDTLSPLKFVLESTTTTTTRSRSTFSEEASKGCFTFLLSASRRKKKWKQKRKRKGMINRSSWVVALLGCRIIRYRLGWSVWYLVRTSAAARFEHLGLYSRYYHSDLHLASYQTIPLPSAYANGELTFLCFTCRCMLTVKSRHSNVDFMDLWCMCVTAGLGWRAWCLDKFVAMWMTLGRPGTTGGWLTIVCILSVAGCSTVHAWYPCKMKRAGKLLPPKRSWSNRPTQLRLASTGVASEMSVTWVLPASERHSYVEYGDERATLKHRVAAVKTHSYGATGPKAKLFCSAVMTRLKPSTKWVAPHSVTSLTRMQGRSG